MAFKFVLAFALMAAASAGYAPAQVYHSAPAQVYHSAPAQVYHSAPAVSYAAPVATYAHAPAVVKTIAAPVTTYAHAPATVVKTSYAAQPIYAKAAEEYDPHPQYKYAYDVQDSLSGDSKSQVEERDGDVVRGEYSLVDADGYKRTVTYTADSVNGFNAVVNREPLYKAAVVKTAYAAPVATYAAPAVVKTVAPAAYTSYAAPAVVKSFAPAAYTTYSAPAVVKSVAPAYTTYSAPAVVKSVAPAYTSYAAPAYVHHH